MTQTGDRLPLPLPLPNQLDLRGHTALVTGAGSPVGIGFATARLLGSLGARVAITATCPGPASTRWDSWRT